MYDYIIIGGGPSGLSMCQLLLKTGKTILLLEGENSLGGCHRVARIDGKFTEHAPRIYSSTYVNLSTLFKDMGFNFNDIFTKYKFTLSSIGKKTIKSLQFYELWHLSVAFVKLVFNINYGKDISLDSFINKYNFTSESKNYIDRLCRLVDGGTSLNFSLNQFLEIVNQQFFHSLYQPMYPNDSKDGFITRWVNYLTSNKNVIVKVNSRLTKVIPNQNKIIINSKDVYLYKKLIFATSPFNIQEILPIYPQKYIANTTYIDYISLTFYWKKRLNLPEVYGFSKSDWGVVYVVLSDYFKTETGTLITTTITILDEKSRRTGKTANQTVNLNDIKEEVKFQLYEAFATDIPEPTSITLYPEISYNSMLKKWGNNKNKSFFKAYKEPYVSNKVGNYKNIYNVGYQNGHHTYNFNSIEAAVSNSMYLASVLEPTVNFPKIKSSITIIDVAYITMLFFLLLNIFIVIKYKITSPVYYIYLIFVTIFLTNSINIKDTVG